MRPTGPAAPWSFIPVTNPLERLNKEVKRRTDVVGVFPNPEALLRLAGAVLVEAHDEWQVSDRRYLSEGSMALLTATTEEAAGATLWLEPWPSRPWPPADAHLLSGRTRPAKVVRTQGAGRHSTALTRRLQPGPGRAGSG